MSWKEQAKCSGEDISLFFPGEGEQADTRAYALCYGCPVRAECLENAIENHEQGMWAGTNEDDRRKIRRDRDRPDHVHVPHTGTYYCTVCLGPFFPLRMVQGPSAPRYCSSKCKSDSRTLRAQKGGTRRAGKDRPPAPPDEPRCQNCADRIPPWTNRTCYCSEACGRAAKNKRSRAKRLAISSGLISLPHAAEC